MFYTSGRTANETAFLYQLLAPSLGTNKRAGLLEHVPRIVRHGPEADYDVIRDHIARVLTGFEDVNARLRGKHGFVLPNPTRDERRFATDIGRARFTVSPLEYLTAPPGHLILQNVRSHDQYNTTFYGVDDRYRGIAHARRVVLVHPEDLADLGLTDRQLVDVVSVYDASRGRVHARGVPDRARLLSGVLPEANALVHRDLVARESNTPGSRRSRCGSSLGPAHGPPTSSPSR